MSYKILLVNAEAAERAIATKFLRSKGLDVINAINGLDAVHKIENNKFDAVLSELKMPILDGLGLVAKLADSPSWGQYQFLLMIDLDTQGDLVTESEQLHVWRKPLSLEKIYIELSKLLGEKHDTEILTQHEEILLNNEDHIYLEMMKDMLSENNSLSKIIEFMNETKESETLQEIANSFYSHFKSALNTDTRLWFLLDKKASIIGENENAPSPSEGSVSFVTVSQILKEKPLFKVENSNYYLCIKDFVLEILNYPKNFKHLEQLATMFLKNFILVYRAFNDRAYFLRLKEQLAFAGGLKDTIVTNLEQIRDSSGDLSATISDKVDEVLELMDQLSGDQEIKIEIENSILEGLNKLQFADINNQKLYSIIKNLESLFKVIRESVESKDDYLNHTSGVDLQNVASQSILHRDTADQNGVDDLLANLGL